MADYGLVTRVYPDAGTEVGYRCEYGHDAVGQRLSHDIYDEIYDDGARVFADTWAWDSVGNSTEYASFTEAPGEADRIWTWEQDAAGMTPRAAQTSPSGAGPEGVITIEQACC